MDLVGETPSAIEGRAPDWAAFGVRTEVARQSPESLYAPGVPGFLQRDGYWLDQCEVHLIQFVDGSCLSL